MKSRRTTLTLFAAGLLACSSSAFADDSADKLSATFDLPLLSSYTWRGQVLNDEAVLQPALTVSKGAVSLNVWTNFNLTDSVTDSAEFSEVDLTAAYTLPIEAADVSVGIVQYTFPNLDAEDTGELFATASIPDLCVTPSAAVYYDYRQIDGFYFSAGLSRDFEIQEKLVLETSATIGFGTENYNSGYFESDKAGFNDLLLSVSLPIELPESWTVSPTIQYSVLLDDDVRDGGKELYDHKDILIGGVALSYEF